MSAMVTSVDDNVKADEEQDDGSDKGQSVPALAAGTFMPMPAPLPGYGYQRPQGSHPGGFAFPPQPMMPFPGGVFPPVMGQHQPYGYAAPGMSLPSPGGKSDGTQQACTVHLPGLPRPFDVPFPARKLPVCPRCKKNYRSRELCRQRDEHRALPWQTVYVVVTLTDEVLEKGEDGKLSVADVPVVAELQEMPEMCRGPADGFMTRQPMCKICKEKNYTRDYCRVTSKHTTPPYHAVYIKLVPKSDSADMGRVFKKKKRKPEGNADGRPMQDSDSPVIDVEEDQSDDLTEIHQSRTIFAEISARKITVKWCEQIQYPEVMEGNSALASSGMMPSYMNMNNNPNMQGQMWDAFRAGAMWAQAQGSQLPPMGGPMPVNFGMPMGGYGHDDHKLPSSPDVKSPMPSL